MFIKWLQANSNVSWEKFFNALDLATGAVPSNTFYDSEYNYIN